MFVEKTRPTLAGIASYVWAALKPYSIIPAANA
jgi:hypothetical protein